MIIDFIPSYQAPKLFVFLQDSCKWWTWKNTESGRGLLKFTIPESTSKDWVKPRFEEIPIPGPLEYEAGMVTTRQDVLYFSYPGNRM